MKQFLRIFAGLLVSLPCVCLGAEKESRLPSTQRLYTDLRYELSAGSVWKTRVTVPSSIAGTFWSTSLNGRPVIITAAHNVGAGPNSTPAILFSNGTNGTKYVIGKNAKLLSLSANTLLGTLAFEVEEAGLLGKSTDVILLRPKDPSVFKASRMLTLAVSVPSIGDKVKVCGFPGTGHEQPESASIADVRAGQGFFVLDTSLDSGFSGAVVLNEQGKAIGVVTGTERKQATAILLTPEMLSKADWKPIKDVRRGAAN